MAHDIMVKYTIISCAKRKVYEKVLVTIIMKSSVISTGKLTKNQMGYSSFHPDYWNPALEFPVCL